MDREKLDEILEQHKKWLHHKKGGKRAILDGASLRNASLDGASLRNASLDGASLEGASLRNASLDGASLRNASLRNASLDGASLDGASLEGASLRNASLDGANIDYSVWPLWCGSLDAIVDKRIFAQFAYHLCRVIVDDEECKAAQRALYPIANQFHRVYECGRLGEDSNE